MEPRPLPRHGRVVRCAILATTIAVVSTLSTACSSSGPSSDADPAQASSAVAETFYLAEGERQCLTEGFAESPTALDAMVDTDEPSAGDLEAVTAVLDGCVSPDEVARSVAVRITAALPPEDPADAPAQQACLVEQVSMLDPASTDALVGGLVLLSNAPQAGDLALARGDAVNRLYEACAVTVGP